MRSARFISMIVLAAAVAVAAALAVENLVLASISLARGERSEERRVGKEWFA